MVDLVTRPAVPGWRQRACNPGVAVPDLTETVDLLKEIADAVAETDPVRANQRITASHRHLSLALRAATGADAGANFHTWAVWGSLKAGETIRREDTRRLRWFVDLVAVLGAVAFTLVAALGWISLAWPHALAIGSAPAVVVMGIFRWRLGRTARAILGGNRTVLADIGPATARLATFLDTLRPGPSETGGQELLRQAFTNYYWARHELTPKTRHERMLLANGYAILHEHRRLQPYLEAAMPRLLPRAITGHMLGYRLGDQRGYRVGRDVPPVRGASFPPTLATLELPQLRAFYDGPAGWGRAPDSLAGSAAGDWSMLGDRMAYIVALFRSRHLEPVLFAAAGHDSLQVPGIHHARYRVSTLAVIREVALSTRRQAGQVIEPTEKTAPPLSSS